MKGFKVSEAIAKNGGEIGKVFTDKHMYRRLLTLRQSTGCAVYHRDIQAPV